MHLLINENDPRERSEKKPLICFPLGRAAGNEAIIPEKCIDVYYARHPRTKTMLMRSLYIT